MTVPDFSINFVNKSSYPCTLYRKWDDADFATTIIKSPDQTLDGGSGNETLSWEQSASNFGTGNYSADLLYKTKDGVVFGVRIHVPVQVLMIGRAPYYSTWLKDGDWTESEPANPYDFDSNKLGFNCKVVPVAGHRSLYLTVTITDK